MTSARRPPSFMPGMPLTQPSTIPGETSVVSNGFLPHEESNSLSLEYATPTYWTVTFSPALAARPLPVTTSLVTSSIGGRPGKLDSVGLRSRSVETCSSRSTPAALEEDCDADDESPGLSSPGLSSPAQPASAIAAAMSSARAARRSLTPS